ncbi:hypothetical protein GCM10009861_07270 [Neomicrococcus aestuarii]
MESLRQTSGEVVHGLRGMGCSKYVGCGVKPRAPDVAIHKFLPVKACAFSPDSTFLEDFSLETGALQF